jgi:hypothetical protein
MFEHSLRFLMEVPIKIISFLNYRNNNASINRQKKLKMVELIRKIILVHTNNLHPYLIIILKYSKIF